MHKKTRLTVAISPDESPTVKKGATITKGDTIIKPRGETKQIHIDLAKLLRLPPREVLKKLIVREGARITPRQVLALKSGVLKNMIVRAPTGGEFVIIDKDAGIVGITQKVGQAEEVKAWFEGTVIEVEKDKLIFEVTGMVIFAREGKGQPVWGRLLVLSPETTALSMPTEIGDAVISVKEAHSEIVAKADALGSVAIIAEQVEQPPFSLPYLLIEDIGHLGQFHDQMVIVYGDRKELLILTQEK